MDVAKRADPGVGAKNINKAQLGKVQSKGKSSRQLVLRSKCFGASNRK